MINAIIKGIAKALYNEFGYRIHTESIEQGLKEPCFFVLCVNPTHELYNWNRYFRENDFCIHYFPQSSNRQREECQDAAERMMECLEIITADGIQIRGTDMNYEFEDGTLRFFVNYNCFVYRIDNSDPMEEATISTIAKGEGEL